MKGLVEVGILAAALAFSVAAMSAAQSPQDESQPQGQQQPQQEAQQEPQQEPQAPPPPAQAPESTPQTPPAEQQTAKPQEPATATPQAPATAKPEPPATATPDHPILKRKPTHKRSRKKSGEKSDPSKVVVRNGGAKGGSPQLAPAQSKEQQLHSRENTGQLLATTDANLKSVAGRQLTPAQQSMMEQIRTYMTQSKAASDAGDLNRAHTLAYKAQLLSDELAKK